jgi:hypothetical protein
MKDTVTVTVAVMHLHSYRRLLYIVTLLLLCILFCTNIYVNSQGITQSKITSKDSATAAVPSSATTTTAQQHTATDNDITVQPSSSPQQQQQPAIPSHISKALKQAKLRNERLRKQRISFDQRLVKKQHAIDAKHVASEKKKQQSNDPAVKEQAAKKLKWMIEQSYSDESENHIIDITSDDYRKYIFASPRPYWTMVAHQALDSRYQCPACPSFHSTTLQLASIVQQRNAMMHNISSSVSSGDSELLHHYAQLSADNKKSELPLFLVEADISQNSDIFSEIGTFVNTCIKHHIDILISTELYCTVLYCTVLYCTVMYTRTNGVDRQSR